MDIWSFLPSDEESEMTVEDVRKRRIIVERECNQLCQELSALDDRFGQPSTDRRT